MSGTYFPIVGDYRVSSVFGNRSSPGGIGSTNHRGIDLAAPIGTPVVAPVSGTILSAGTAGGYGNLITMRGDDGNLYKFGHLSSYNVRAGMPVIGGSQIGAVGNTGRSTGPHLHFEVRDKSGKAINPSGLLKGALKQGKDTLLKAGKDLLGIGDIDAGDVANVIVPGSGVVLDGLGLTGDCNWLCQLQNWIKDSGFFQRLALAILAFIVLAGAFYMMKSNIFEQATSRLKGAIK